MKAEGVGNRLCFWSGKIDSEGPSKAGDNQYSPFPLTRLTFPDPWSVQPQLRQKLDTWLISSCHDSGQEMCLEQSLIYWCILLILMVAMHCLHTKNNQNKVKWSYPCFGGTFILLFFMNSLLLYSASWITISGCLLSESLNHFLKWLILITEFLRNKTSVF